MGLMGTNSYGLVSARAPSAASIAQAAGPVSAPAPSPGGGGLGGSTSRYATNTAGGGIQRAWDPYGDGGGQGGQEAGAPKPAYRMNPGATRSGTNQNTGAYQQQAAGRFDAGGVNTGGPAPAQNAVQQYQNQGPDLAAIQMEMQRKNVGAQLNANPQNSALAGYMMG